MPISLVVVTWSAGKLAVGPRFEPTTAHIFVSYWAKWGAFLVKNHSGVDSGTSSPPNSSFDLSSSPSV